MIDEGRICEVANGPMLLPEDPNFIVIQGKHADSKIRTSPK
jgi:hypothetical protein